MSSDGECSWDSNDDSINNSNTFDLNELPSFKLKSSSSFLKKKNNSKKKIVEIIEKNDFQSENTETNITIENDIEKESKIEKPVVVPNEILALINDFLPSSMINGKFNLKQAKIRWKLQRQRKKLMKLANIEIEKDQNETETKLENETTNETPSTPKKVSENISTSTPRKIRRTSGVIFSKK